MISSKWSWFMAVIRAHSRIDGTKRARYVRCECDGCWAMRRALREMRGIK